MYTQTENPIIINRACISYIAAIALYEAKLAPLTRPETSAHTSQATTRQIQPSDPLTQSTTPSLLAITDAQRGRTRMEWAIPVAIIGVVVVCVTSATLVLIRSRRAQPEIINDIEPVHLYEIPSELVAAGPLYDNVNPNDYRERDQLSGEP